jgi:hypothetical protein
MKYNREAEKAARKEAYRQAGYSDDLPPDQKRAALEVANQLFQEYLDECAAIEAEEEEVYRMSEIKLRRNRDAA